MISHRILSIGVILAIISTHVQSDSDVSMTHGSTIAMVDVKISQEDVLTVDLKNVIKYDGVCTGQAEITVSMLSNGIKRFYGDGCWQPMAQGSWINFTVLKTNGESGYIRQPIENFIILDQAVFSQLLRPELTKTWEDDTDEKRMQYYDKETRLWIHGREEILDKNTGKWHFK